MSILHLCSIFAMAILYLCHSTDAITTRTHPENIQVVAGTTITLNCVVDDKGSNSIYWFRHKTQSYLTKNMKVFHQAGALRDFWTRITVVGNTRNGEYNLQIKNVTFDDADRYSCVFFDGSRYVSESRAGEIKVYGAPEEGFPKCSLNPSTGVGPGSRITIECLSKRSTGAPNLRLDWHRWFEMLPGSFIQGNDPRANYATELTAQDNGAVFTCLENSPILDTPRTCNIRPFFIPTNVTIIALQRGHASQNTKKQSNISFIEPGHEVLLKCKAEAIPPATNYTWFVAGEPVKETTSKYQLENKGANLRIIDVQTADNGTLIECKVWNSVLIEGSGETYLEVEQRVKSAHTAGSRPFTPSNVGYIIVPTLALIILISIVILFVRRSRSKKLSHRRSSDFQLREEPPPPPPAKERFRPAVQVRPIISDNTPDVVMDAQALNIEPDIEETEPLTGVTICSTPHEAIVEHLRENNPQDGDVENNPRADKTASRVLMVGRLSSVTSASDPSDNHREHDNHDTQLYTKPHKKGRRKSKEIRRVSGIKKSEISCPISLSSETDSIYVNCPTGPVHV